MHDAAIVCCFGSLDRITMPLIPGDIVDKSLPSVQPDDRFAEFAGAGFRSREQRVA
jgi:hypothetical protein